jgi:hypothetical protein
VIKLQVLKDSQPQITQGTQPVRGSTANAAEGVDYGIRKRGMVVSEHTRRLYQHIDSGENKKPSWGFLILKQSAVLAELLVNLGFLV